MPAQDNVRTLIIQVAYYVFLMCTVDVPLPPCVITDVVFVDAVFSLRTPAGLQLLRPTGHDVLPPPPVNGHVMLIHLKSDGVFKDCWTFH